MNVPFQHLLETASRLKFVLIYERLGEIAGYYHKIENQKLIHINESLPEWYKFEILESCLSHARENENEFHLILNNLNNLEQPGTPVAQ